MKLIKQSTQTSICKELIEARTLLKRLKGFMFDKKIDPSQGLWIKKCKSVHTCFMNFNIDLIFINKEKKIVGLVENLHPWKLSPFYWKADSVIEMPKNTINKYQLEVGEQLDVVH